MSARRRRSTFAIVLVMLTGCMEPHHSAEPPAVLTVADGCSSSARSIQVGFSLLRAVHDVLHGLNYVTPQITHMLERNYIRDQGLWSGPRGLSDRQREVLQMLAEGRTAKEITCILQVSFRAGYSTRLNIRSYPRRSNCTRFSKSTQGISCPTVSCDSSQRETHRQR